MTTNSFNHLRVVVHINDGDNDERNCHNNKNKTFTNSYRTCGTGQKDNIAGQMVAKPAPHITSPKNETVECNTKTEVLLLDDKTLQLNLLSTDKEGPYTNISHKMHFDHVSHDTKDMIKLELAIVMDELLLKRNNVSIIRFFTEQEMDIKIFFELLVIFLDKRIYHQKYKLQYVKLECLDIAASKENSKNPPREKSFSIKANLAGLDTSDEDNLNNNNNNATFEMSKNDQNDFRSTKDLLIWLLNEYLQTFNDKKCHEKLKFTFSIIDHQQNLFKVKLFLFNINLNLMNIEDRNHWHRYMDHLNKGCEGLDCNFIHSNLTISLSGHIEGVSSKNTLLLFDVPTDITMATDTIEILQMADTVVNNRKKQQTILLNKQLNLDRRKSISSADCSNCASLLTANQQLNNLSANYNENSRRSSLPSTVQTKSKGLSFSMTNNVPHLSLTRSPRMKNVYSRPDFNTLSSWYRKIDECYKNLSSTREKYFARYFELKTKQISSNIHNMFNSLESLYFKQSEQEQNEFQENQLELHKLFEIYHNARTLFRQLSLDIKESEFEEILKIYLETKEFDLNKSAAILKQMHLDCCKQYLKFTFNDICNDLNSEFDI